ncbi:MULTISPECIES: YtxH domain-containing protein [Jeotgalicoccus]|jgi:Gas vesicle protein|uniref:Gas vesicle protein n=2 Tax=Jeotgalicoccus TaxID=227979 RepID=A0A3E0B0B5_9STAP|nr:MULTISPECIES: YtxH domain-containing protein [Jeotgalicoccus]MBF0754102.1 YtxH domain-containing protein [Jeotgalicoccus nanhaiensis]REG25397.1 gas vesicle protein [Jeotgalicoccus halotolerans]TFU61586.1 YtxH domain-containing protein [Jeotgalicoccus nanhaiensis]
METYNRDRHVKGVESYDAQVETSTGRDFTVGLALGLFVGVVGGLFIAPKSGDALRDDIKKLQDSVVNEQNDGPSISEKLDEKVSDVKQMVKDKKAEMDEKSRVKKLDDSAVQLQQQAIQEEVADSNLKRPNVVDMSKYAEKSVAKPKKSDK